MKKFFLPFFIFTAISISALNYSNALSHNENSVKFILWREGPYLQAVIKEIDSNLTDQNFILNNGSINTLLDSTDILYGDLPGYERPIVVIPISNFDIAVKYGGMFPRVNIIMCYKYGNSMPSLINLPANMIPPNVLLIAGGNILNDWTTGNGFSFIDSSEIQFMADGQPRFNYKISKIGVKQDTIKLFSEDLLNSVGAGWIVWTHFSNDENIIENIISTRSRVISKNYDSGYVTVVSIEETESRNFQLTTKGFVTVHFLSGAAGSVAAKIRQIMDGRHCSFVEARECGKMTGSNGGIRNNSTGYGHLNVRAAIEYIIPADSFDEQNDMSIPSEFSVSQNYPNPFNPSTKINYDMPVDGKVSVKVFDMSGKVMASLVDGVQSAGYYTVTLNANNLSSGIYFYSVNISGSHNFVMTKKMVLLK